MAYRFALCLFGGFYRDGAGALGVFSVGASSKSIATFCTTLCDERPFQYRQEDQGFKPFLGHSAPVVPLSFTT